MLSLEVVKEMYLVDTTEEAMQLIGDQEYEQII